MASHTEAAHTPHIHGGPKLYAAVLAALLFLTVVTVGASMIDFGGGMANVIIAMVIASIKASLVALFFMHLRWEGRMNAIIFCSTLFFLGLFLIGCYTDTVARPMLEPTNLKAPLPGAKPGQPGTPAGGQTGTQPGGQTGTHSGNQSGNPLPSGEKPANPTPSIPGSSPQGSHGGAAAGTNNPAPSAH